jgi:nicotinamidase-related amidase
LLEIQDFNLKGVFVMSNDTAVVIIDVQVGMFDPADPVYRGEEMLATLKRLLAKARAAQIPLFYVQHNEGKGAPLETNTPGWQIHEAIAPREGEPVIQKHYPDSFQQTTLQDELQARGIKKLVIAGIQTDYCIDTSCRRAFSLGYEVTLVKDGHSTWNDAAITAPQIIAHHNLVLGGWFATVKNEEEIAFERVTA